MPWLVFAWRDSHARTTNRRFQLLVTLLVALGFLGGLFIYLLIHPRRTLAEEYVQQVEEEALLAEMAERCTCPTCQTHLIDDFQVCPTFGSVLKRPCPRGPHLLNLHWHFCHRSALALVNRGPGSAPPPMLPASQGLRNVYMVQAEV